MNCAQLEQVVCKGRKNKALFSADLSISTVSVLRLAQANSTARPYPLGRFTLDMQRTVHQYETDFGRITQVKKSAHVKREEDGTSL